MHRRSGRQAAPGTFTVIVSSTKKRGRSTDVKSTRRTVPLAVCLLGELWESRLRTVVQLSVPSPGALFAQKVWYVHVASHRS